MNANKLFLLLFFASVTFIRCKKDPVHAPDFEVTIPRNTYSVGDTVNFEITGNPDFLIFFPGTPGKEYKEGAKLNGTPIKGMDVRLERYAFIYTSPGEFTATFVGSTNSVYHREELVKSIRLTVE